MIPALMIDYPPGLVHAFTTSTSRWRPVACSSAMRAVPAARRAADAGAQLDRGPVRADADGVAGRDAPALGVVRGELDLGGRALELELGRALDRRPGEERAVALQAQVAEQVLARRLGQRVGRRRRGGRRGHVGRSGRQGRTLPDLAVGDAAVQLLGELGEDDRGVRRDRDAEALGELRDPRELVRGGRDRRAAQALDASFEVDVGAVALEVARAGQDEVGPADGEPVEHRDREDVLRALGERPHGRVGSSLVARDDQQADRLRVGLLAVRGRSPRVGDTAAVRGGRQVEGGAAVLPFEAERVRELGEPRAAAPAASGPDQDRVLGAAQRVLELGVQAAVRDLLHPRPVAAREPDPEIDDRRPVRHRLVADHDDELSACDRRERRAERVERVRGRLREHGGVGTRALAEELPERIGLLDGLRAGERGHDPSLGAADQRLCAIERVVPGELAESTATDPLQRLADAVVGGDVPEGEAALVAQPAPVDLGVVAREDALRLALARRHADVAADGAEPADRGHVLDLPRAGLEAVLRREQRAHGAELGHVAGERAGVGLVLERGDHRQRAAVAGHELPVLGDVLREARAAVAEDAALAVERDRGRERDRLVERPLRERHPARARAPAERQVLERALAALVADGAVERVVDEDELQRRVLALGRLLRGLRRLHDHPVLGGQRAPGLELRDSLDLDEAHAAGADGRPEPRLVAEDGDLDARRTRPSRRGRCPWAPRPRARRSSA